MVAQRDVIPTPASLRRNEMLALNKLAALRYMEIVNCPGFEVSGNFSLIASPSHGAQSCVAVPSRGDAAKTIPVQIRRQTKLNRSEIFTLIGYSVVPSQPRWLEDERLWDA